MNSKDDFSNFTEVEFRRLLKIAKKNFTFCKFNEFLPGEKIVIWRHDVDFSINRAVALAQIEAEEGVSATYFIRTRGDAYSILESDHKVMIHRINDLGHEVGLHFEVSDIPVKSVIHLEELLERDKSLFNSELGIEIATFSFHNPNADLLAYSNDAYAGLLNAYAKKFFTEFTYVSDSNGYWRFNSLEEVMMDEKVNKLQVLTHPEWWVPNAMSPFERITRVAMGRANSFLARYEEGLERSGRENIR